MEKTYNWYDTLKTGLSRISNTSQVLRSYLISINILPINDEINKRINFSIEMQQEFMANINELASELHILEKEGVFFSPIDLLREYEFLNNNLNYQLSYFYQILKYIRLILNSNSKKHFLNNQELSDFLANQIKYSIEELNSFKISRLISK